MLTCVCRLLLVLSILCWNGNFFPALAQSGARASQDGPLLPLVDFHDLPLNEVLRLLNEQTGLNMVSSAAAARVRVSLYLRQVAPLAVLDTVARAHNLWYRRDPQSGIISVRTIAEFQRDLASFREDRTEVFTLLYPNALDIAGALADLFGDRVQLSLGGNDTETFNELSERFDRFDLIDRRSQGFGGTQIGGTGGGGGGGRSAVTTQSDRTVLSDRATSTTLSRRGQRGTTTQGTRQTSRSRERERDLPAQITAEEAQALEESASGVADADTATVAEVLRRRPAVIFVTIIRKHNRLLIRTSDEQALEQIRDLIQRLDVPTPLVLLEVKILSVDLGDDFNSVFDFQFQKSGTLGGFSGGEIQAPSLGSLLPGGTGLTPGNLIFQFVNSNFRVRLQLLESKNRLTTLATPLLLTVNNEVSRLFVGEERPLNRSFTGPQTVVNNTGIGSTTTPGSTSIEFRPVGTTLLLTPNINADRTVTLRILQEISSISPNPAPVLVPTSTGFVQQFVDIVQSRTVSGTFVAKDNLTVAIGGLIEEGVADQRDAVPVLGKIPLLGVLFRRQQTGRTRRELIILIRPYILNTPTEGESMSRLLLDELSLHPSAPEGRGALGSHTPREVLRPEPAQSTLQESLRFHSVTPKDY
ncbi:MAG: type II secretion system protein GspD [Candidatus Tectimicrobiota bacterium]